MEQAEQLYKLGLKAIIRNDKGEVLLLQTKRETNDSVNTYWDFPGGKVNVDENPFDALTREVREETQLEGLKILKPYTFTVAKLKLNHQESQTGLIIHAYLCDIDIKQNILLSPEHSDFGWFDPSHVSHFLESKYDSDFIEHISQLNSSN